MPLVSGLAAYVRAGGPLRGRAALRYAYERLLFECMLAMRLLDTDAGERGGDAADGAPQAPHERAWADTASSWRER
jgi:hypothetical protein